MSQCCWLSMKTTRGRTANRTDGRSGWGKTADAGRWSLLRDQAMGFCFEAGADEDTHFPRPAWKLCATWWRQVAGSLYACAGCAAGAQTRWGCLSAVYKPEPRRTIGLVYRPGSPLRTAMSSWQRPSAQEWMAISIKVKTGGLSHLAQLPDRLPPSSVVKGGVDEVLNSVAATFLFLIAWPI